MATPTLRPSSVTSSIRLPSGTVPTSVTSLPFGLYSDTDSGLYSRYFLSGAAEQVAYTYKKLGGDVLDIELTEGNIFAAYEESVLEYSYIVNIHQTKNVLSNLLGSSTGSFDQDGQIKSGDALSGSSVVERAVALKFPRFESAYAKRISMGMATEAGIGGEKTIYSASFTSVDDQQDYDLQQLVSSSAVDGDFGSTNPVGNKRVYITKVFYKTPHAMWRFYGYYGGLNTVGNLASYGQWADESTFEIVPAWQNKAQAMTFEDAIYTRNSHYSYEIKNNKLRLFPTPISASPKKFWFEFYIETDPWIPDNSDKRTGTDGINNMNTIPFENIPFDNINSIGKQWIRRFCLSLSKETLGNIRSKFTTIPIPGESVTLNGPALITQAQSEQEKLREELKKVLDELTYDSLADTDAKKVEAANKVQVKVPLPVFVG